MLKKAITTGVAACASVALAAVPAHAAAVVKSQLKCYTDGPAASCTLTKSGAILSAPGAGTNAAAVYVTGKRLAGTSVSKVDYSFDWSGDTNGGSPRWSIAIDENGDGATDNYAFLDAQNCGGVDGGSGTVSTTLSSCPVYEGPNSYANWDAFALANPTYTIARDTSFVIADYDTPSVTISNVTYSIG